MEVEVRKVTCGHPDTFKSFRWEKEKFSDRFNSEYEYCDCRICKSSIYTGLFRMVGTSGNNLNWDTIPSTKEQDMNKDNLSVSRVIKALHAKDESGLSLKQFARKLRSEGNEIAADWFNNKAGICNQPRSDKNQARADAERTATKGAKRSKKKGSGTAAAS